MAHQACSSWAEELPLVLLGVRSSFKEELGYTTVELVYGTTLRVPEFGNDERPSDVVLDHVNQRLRRQVNSSCSTYCPVPEPVTCDQSKPYRESDGSCNNLDNPSWGQAYSCERRLLPAAYKDGVSEPRVARSGEPLPSARLVSYKVHPPINIRDKQLTHMAMAFGQFVDHDITFVPPNTLPPLETYLGAQNGFTNGTVPMNIEVPAGDPFYAKFQNTSLFFTRSLPCCHCQLGPREQMNSRTSFIDASQIYGIKDDITDSVRSFSGGLLATQGPDDSALLPPSLYPNNDTCSIPDEDKICFRAGDFRVNQNPGLVTMHTIFLRDHNRIARKLAIINPNWDDERLFQVTRRIVEARYQHVVFSEWLPSIVGSDAMAEYRLLPLKNGYTDYNSSVDPTMFNEFAAAAFRFGHSDVVGYFNLVATGGAKVGVILLKDAYFQPFEFYKGIEDSATRGLIQQPMWKTDRYGDSAVTNYLYRARGSPNGNDLFAVDIQRGRDHGTRPYVDYVQLCQNLTLTSFKDLYRRKLMPTIVATLYSHIYQDVGDIDLFSAGISEYNVPGAAMGPTFLCIVARMFSALKWGDRFYYEHKDQAGSFTPEQLQTIRQTTLAKIICENTRFGSRVHRNVFRQPKLLEKEEDCKDLPDIELVHWRNG
ncbi:peroxidase-like [Dermacentor silvarum]|uniref:peroxidase-like n=1 Tax=Dermacentor silvarum TaxID=543639 RepID=UPI00189BB958|nr:peroxidase-like [Dermacentor silvarum]